MIMNDQPRDDFFIAGGTLRPRDSSYIRRSADDQLYHHIMKGEFCYVLTPRQMGKSSLMVRTAVRLQENGFAAAKIDLTKIGKTDVGRWYLGILTQIEKDLKLGTNPGQWWKDHEHLSAVQRFIDFLREAVLTMTDRNIAIFVDEIDSTLTYTFRDDFFAGIRSLYNARAVDPQYERLTFVLLGVAAPTDLISDRTRTPFNIGQEISLTNFSRKEISIFEPILEQNFPGHGAAILNRIYDWSRGHPYLTQKLCMAIAEQKLLLNEVQFDDFIKRLFLSQEEYRETNLQFVRDMLIKSPQKRQLISLYAKIRKGEKVIENKKSSLQNQLRLSGLVRSQAGYLVVNNKIYYEAFNPEWIKENTEVNWSRVISFIGAPIVLFVIAVWGYNNVYVPYQITTANDCFLNLQNSSEKRLTCLANMFQSDRFLTRGNNDDLAREKYFSLSKWEEQALIFHAEHPDSQDLIEVIRGLYLGMGEVLPGENTPLLETMNEALERLERTRETDQLEQELDAWLSARRSLELNNNATALAHYNNAIRINAENPSTLLERGMLFLRSADYANAMRNFDEAIRVSKISAPVEQPTELPATQTAVPPQLPILTPMATAEATETALADSAGQPTFPAAFSTPIPITTPFILIPPATSFGFPSITSEFYTHTKRVMVIRNIIAEFIGLRFILGGSSDDEYTNLKAVPEIALLEASPLRLTIQTQDRTAEFLQAGEVINYNYVITNTGAVSLAAPAIVTDAERQVTCPGISTVGNLNNFLDINETITCVATYTVTEDDVNAGSITNLAVASVGGKRSDQAGLTLTRSPALRLSQTASPQTYDRIGQEVTYTFVITNVWSTSLGPAQFTISDDRLGAPFDCGPASITLASNQTVSCSMSYRVNEVDLSGVGLKSTATASGAGQTSASASTTITNIAFTLPPPTIAPMNISFDPGTTTASRIGVINPDELIQFSVNATEGQVLTVQLTTVPGEVALGVTGPTGLTYKIHDFLYTWSMTVTTSGSYVIDLIAISGGSPKSYTLQVSLTTATIPVNINSVIGAGTLEAEWIVISYQGNDQINLANWELRDEDGNVFVFPQLILHTNGAVQVHTASGADTLTDLYWGKHDAVWELDEEAQLFDPKGNLRAVYNVP
jgi:tetratricopeptide (TPR) repeat protein